jgi:hypothetical protein
MPVVRGDRQTQGTLELYSVKIQGAESWYDLTTSGTPDFFNSKAGEILPTSPNALQAFFFIDSVHTAGYRPQTALTCLPGTFMHPHSRTGWMTGAVQNTCGQPRVFNTQAKSRDTPVTPVAGR